MNIRYKWGIITSAILISYFLVMKFAGLVHILELRYLNAFIMLGGIWFAVREFKRKFEFNYFSGLITGLSTGFIATTIFAVFSFLYVTVIDPAFMKAIQENDLMGQYLNQYLVPVQIFIEGATSAFLFSYIAMQRLKVSRTAETEQKLKGKPSEMVKEAK